MNSTAIECKLIRAGGTRATIDNTEYHFQPYTDGAHVCDIANEEHADRFLAIREGYRLYRGEGKPVGSQAAAPVAKPAAPAAVPEPVASAPVLNICTNLFEPEYTIHGTTYALLAVAQRAQITLCISTEAWNALTDIERSDAIEAELDSIASAISATPFEPPPADDRATLAAEYERLYGKKPHHNTGIDKLRDLIAAKQ